MNMKRNNRRIVKRVFQVLGLLLLIFIVVFLRSAFPIVTGYGAKNLCSCVFISDREPEDVIAKELGTFPLSLGKFTINYEDSSASSTVWGMARKKAIYRKGLGCTLINSVTEESLRAVNFDQPAFPYDPDTVSWPRGNILPNSLPGYIDQQALNKAMAAAFVEPDPEAPHYTRAVVVLHKGQLVGEQYAEGFGPEIPQISWSMAKSFTNALVGLLSKDGKLDIHEKAPVDAWADQEDPRNAITLDHLMRMSSGLKWTEIYALPSSATNMLFKDASMAATAAAVPAAIPPDEEWNYSSGTTNIISEIIKDAVGQDNYWNWVHKELFHKIGITTATFEPDASGTFVGSSYLWMTPRDYARFGLLYLQDGIWNGERLLPEGWVDYSQTPTPAAPRGIYGAQFWRNGSPGTFPNVPADAYYASGYQGQFILIVPSKELVVVRLGFTASDNFDFNTLVKDIMAALD